MNLCSLALLVLTVSCSDHIVRTISAQDDDGHYLNEWAVQIQGGESHAESVAAQHGYTLVRALKSIPDHYVLRRSDTPHRSRRSAHHHTRKLSEDERVAFVEQQQQKRRVKRGLVEDRELHDRELAREIAAGGGELHDPELIHEWYLNPTGSEVSRSDEVRADLGVKAVWKKGITGKGIVVTILDDGIERTHPDLKSNYDPEASYDFNDNDEDPSPRYDITNENKHGTRCAGEVSMVANNDKCGTGIAFDSKIGGVRMLDGHVTDRLEGDAICFNRHHVDIYSASWGPNDDGRTTEGPGVMARKAFDLGIKEGRDGKGALYVWASGNGGRIGDNCNSDGYTSSIYTMSISSASQFGNSPWYSEKCSSTLATTYSSGSHEEGKVTSADLHGKCTNSHSGTSAAAPMAAGLFALLLESNPNITWRDAQHIVAHTSRMEPLALEKGWYKNGAGYCVNLAFGFGLMDVLAMVELADPDTWQHVGEQKTCKVSAVKSTQFPQTLNARHQVEIEFTTDGCEGQENEINFLEHVQVVIDLDYSRRGNIYAELESPMGTVTPVMLERKYDSSSKGFKQWSLMSVHTWGENPEGTWKFRVADRSNESSKGKLNSAELVLHGTTEQPEYRKDNPKVCGAPTEIATDDNSHEVEQTIGKLQSLLNTENGAQNAYVENALENIIDKVEEAKQPTTESSYSQQSVLGEILRKLISSQ
uniref:Prohormone convertase 1 n=1 Tax=Aplysia californica TaxID=6500 RepID=Q16944_APLCA|nr:prohormone convertase 1 [Aplysia californica]